MRLSGKFALILTGLAFALTATMARAQEVTWQDHKINPAGLWIVANEIKFAEELEKQTDGRFKINVFPAGSSGFKGNEVLDAISENLLPMGEVWGGHVAGQEQIMELLDLPQFVPGDYEFRQKLWDALLPEYRKLLADRYGVYLLDMMQINPRRLYTKTPVASLADVKGLKIRAIGPADAAFVKALGAEGTTTEWTELYTALQQGVVDGHMAADGAQVAMKFFEVTQHIFNTANAGPSFYVMVNQEALDALPEDLRKTFLEKYEEVRKANRDSYNSMDTRARSFLTSKGNMTVHEVPAADEAKMRQVAGPIVEQWAARLDEESRKIFDMAKSMIDAHTAGK